MADTKKTCSYNVEIEGNQRNLVVNCVGCFLYPSIEDNKMCMERVVDYIVASGTPNAVYVGQPNLDPLFVR